MRFTRLFLIVALSFSALSFQNAKPAFIDQGNTKEIGFLSMPTPWADSIIAQMSLDEKLGQLFSVAAYSNRDTSHTNDILRQIKKYHIGSLTFFQGGPIRQAKLTNTYQEATKVPLLIAIDGEWGLNMRLDSTMRYPWAMTLGAIQDNKLIYQMGLQMAEQFRRIGVQLNFGPDVDVNVNSKNPVINARSFGENPHRVAAKGIAYMEGLQDGNVMACAKHFPGHGDTDVDSHHSLPIIMHSMARMDSVELLPFKALINNGVASVMTAHLDLPNLTTVEHRAASLSPNIVDTLLKQKLGFKGLAITDALNMGGVANYQTTEQVDLEALIAGNDILLMSKDIGKAFEVIKKALQDSTLTEAQITASAYKILKAKEWLGLDKLKPVEIDHLYEDLNQTKYKVLDRQLVEKSLTLIRNKEQIIPIKQLAGKRIVSLALAKEGVSYRPFQKALNRYTKVDTLHFSDLPVVDQKALMDTLLTYDEIIVSLHISDANPWIKFEFDAEFKNFLNILRLKKNIIIDVFANAYSLQDFLAANFVPGLILSYQNSETAQDLSAQLIFGGIQASGKLPVSVSPKMKAGMGEISAARIRLKYTLPEELGIQSEDLAGIDSIVEEGIRDHAYPGASVYFAKDGKVFYHKTFGKFTYEGDEKVNESDLYDLASVTKITSTLTAIMKLDGEGKLSLDDHLGKFLKMTKGTPYAKLVLRDILAHQAGLVAWIPFYLKTLNYGLPRYDLYSKDSTENYSVRVTNDLFIKKSYEDTMYARILETKISDNKEYKYSDIGYYLLKKVVENITKKPIEQYNQEQFYIPLGMSRTTFNPSDKFNLNQIVPTEDDHYFRHELVHGYVHDPGAAMLGGVGGHAGLFSTANDLGKLMQMYLQNGAYGGQQYLDSNVLAEYTKCQFCIGDYPINKKENRRGAGFDKPALHGQPGPTCDCVSYKSYGHSGFTGTYVWVDPTLNLVYIFLSNRVYPDGKINKLVTLNIRTRIQRKVYDAISSAHLPEDVTKIKQKKL